MSQPAASYGIAITGSDRTAAAAKSAERRLSQIPKRAGAANRRFAEDGDRTLRRHSRSIIRTFRDVEQAGARVFGGRSITSGISSRLGGVGAAASAAGTGLGEAAASGGVLSSVLGAVGVAAGATIGLLASAAYAALTVANTWAKGAASIGRTAAIIGVGTKALQEFTAAAERAGVDKGVANGTLASLSQTLNDAKYGRNTGALSVLGRLGVGMQTNKDGTVNVEAMLPQLADALKRQNSSGQRTAARALGIPIEALAAFTQGGAALSADMADAGKHANVLTEDQIATGERIARKGVIVGQMKDRVLGNAGALAAGTMEKGYDAVIQGGQAMLDGASSFGETVERTFKPATDKLGRAADTIDRAARAMLPMGETHAPSGRTGRRSPLRNGVLALSPQDIVDLKKTVATETTGKDSKQLMGVVDTILNRVASGRWGSTVRDVVDARKQFSDVNGPVAWKHGRRSVSEIPMSKVSRRVSTMVDRWLQWREKGAPSSVGDHLNYANPYYSDRRNREWIDKLSGPVYGSGRSIHRHGTAAGLQGARPGAFRIDDTRTPEIPVKVQIEMRGAPAGTRARVEAGRGARPAVSHAFE
ncbi:cell wall hydrolase [Sphingomonas sp. Leaf25]|uniref:cell wall hydrolase n=1 Tax=Sphingomonas sp. Leaf25 TaxID=1735692 RepID=UPI0007013260|nr:cell wall hydrolase [Sphingomonas sp. Leaf25]KQN00571.1 hypothetical protein ASE78_05660 [Sphingomonas sp. Leaf25]